MTGLLLFSIATVTLVLGDPMLDMLAVSPLVWDKMKASPAPRPKIALK